MSHATPIPNAAPERMQQAVMTSPGVIAFREVPVPAMGKGQLRVKIQRIGVCGSDIHVFHGKHPYTSYPVVQGHEVSATVEAMGPEVQGFQVGDRVTIMPQVVCGTCYPCRTGRYHICDELKVMGFQTTGTASERFVVDADKCLVFPAHMSFDEGAMIEPLAVAVHAVSRLDGGVAGKQLVVYGAGPIGNLVAQTALGLGAAKVLVTDMSEHRLQLARDCGIANAVNPKAEDLGAAIVRCFGPDKADAALECVGVQATMDQAIANARKGSDIVVVGVFGDRPLVDLGLVQDRELRLIGTLMYTQKDYEQAIALIQGRRVQLAPLMSAHYPFGQYLAAYQFIEANRDQSMKVFIDFDQA
jgi:L-iditol 2-dehydrogenase